MMRAKTTAIVLGFIAIALPGCDDKQDCQNFAKHLADVLITEKGEAVEDELRDKMIKTTAESCAKEPPEKQILECAMAAKTSEAIKACEPDKEKG